MKNEACEMAEDWSCVHFVRMLAVDQPGVLALVSSKFAQQGVSIASMVQKGRDERNKYAQLVFLTHKASEKAVRAAIAQMNEEMVSQVSIIRVEGY